MVTSTYVAMVLIVGVCAWLYLRRRPGSGVSSSGWEWPREVFGGGSDLADADLVERMARCLADRSTRFGSSYALPGYLGVTLPAGVFEAAAANRAQLTAEVLERFADIMADRARRGRRQGVDFALPSGYSLNLVLSHGPEAMVASFDPIIDVHAALADAGLAGRRISQLGGAEHPAVAATQRPSSDRGSVTAAGSGAAGSGAGGGAVTTITREAGSTTTRTRKGLSFVLTVDDRPLAERQLGSGGGSSVLLIGRGVRADLRCPDELTKISRLHAALTYAHGKVWVEDRGSANGTWVQKPDHALARLSPGEPVELCSGDTVWLDEDHRTNVTCV